MVLTEVLNGTNGHNQWKEELGFGETIQNNLKHAGIEGQHKEFFLEFQFLNLQFCFFCSLSPVPNLL